MKTIEQHPIRNVEQNPFRKVGFVGLDLDGTILKEPERSFPEVFAGKTTRLLGLDPEKARDFAASTMGMPTFRQLNTLSDAIELPENHILRFISPDLRQFIADAIDTEFFNQPIQLFPDVLDALQHLKQQGIHLFISSSRPTKNIHMLLQNHPELAEVIDFAIGTDPNDPSLKKGEGHLRAAAEHFKIPFEDFKEKCAHIGDTPSDMQVCVLTIGRIGTKTREELLEAGATQVIDDFSILSSLFASRDFFQKIYMKGGGKYG